jgi:hypothetical protein
MTQIVNRHTAAIHTHLTGQDRFEQLFFRGERVVDANAHNNNDRVLLNLGLDGVRQPPSYQ